MSYQFSFQPYRKQFRQPLLTHHGTWEIREGIIITLTNPQGERSFGEIAPLPWFGSETQQDALNFCEQIGKIITEDTIYNIPAQLPACQFGFETAWENLSHIPSAEQELIYSYLLPTGEAALYQWQNLHQQARTLTSEVTFKWKIGVNSLNEEIQLFQKLCQALPDNVKLRLDANGALNLAETKTWLTVADEMNRVEFLEQPLSPEQFEQMLHLSTNYSTPLALDESVATLRQLKDCYAKGWRGIFIIKPAIAGSILELRRFLKNSSIDTVFSSVFETAIGRQKALQLASELTNGGRAVGFGVNHWFLEDETYEL